MSSSLLNFYAGCVLARADFFLKQDTYPRVVVLFAYGWLFTIIYLISTSILYFITNIYTNYSDKDERIYLIRVLCVLAFFHIGMLVANLLFELYGKASSSIDIHIFTLFMVGLFYFLVVLKIIGIVYSLVHIAKLKDPHGKYKNKIFRAKIASAIVIVASLAVSYGWYVFLSELHIDCPDILCGP
ncbi:hypothetical protein NEAUS03_1188 [Nematocida ausubeli]|nr:hypothetical protein NEAUS03_1188 [Nematocida ausubeli]